MTTRNRPNYGIFNLVLTNAGTQEIPVLGTRIVMASALQGATVTFGQGGVQQLSGGTPVNALVNVQLGKSLGDAIPLTVGSKISVANKFDSARLSWAAQAGVVVTLMVSDDADGNGVDVDAPPTVTVGSVSISAAGNTAAVTAGGALKVDASATTQPVSIVGAVNPLPNSKQPNVAGASFAGSSAGAAGSTTIVAPGSNPNGIIVRFGLVSGGATASALMTGASAPTTITSNPCILLAEGPAALSVVLTRDIWVPAGQGLYMFQSSTGGFAWAVSYDIQ
jgi:hypothetical protein